jgi:GAF domain-containing protein
VPDPTALERAFQEYARTLLGPYDIGRVLYRITDDMVSILGIDGAGVSIAADDGNLEFVTATGDVITRLEHHQLEAGDGPCQDAFRTGTRSVSDDLRDEDRWPAYTPTAMELGCRAVVGIPMPTDDDRTIGAVNLYRFAAGRWTDDELDVAQLLADMASGSIVNARRLDESERLNAQLQRALDSRIVIEQAKGIISARTGVDVGAAFAILRDHARRHRRPIHDVAGDVVAGTLEL